MYAASAALQNAVAGNHEMAVTVTVLRAGQVLGDVPDAEGSVSATLADRTCRLTVDRGVTDAGLLDPLTDTVVVRTGVPGIELVPIFTGRVDAVATDQETGRVGVTLMSRARELSRDRFDVPFVTQLGAEVRAEIKRIIQRTDPTWGVDTSAAPATLVPTLVFEDDPAKAIDALAASINCTWGPDRSGSFTLRYSPFAPNAVISPVWTLYDGAGGTEARNGLIRSRVNVYNSVTLVVERTDNTSPITVTVRDTDPLSPTLWGGTFGKQGVVVRTNAALDTAQATDQARRMLRASLAVARAWQITTSHLPLIDPGDIITVWINEVPTTQFVESIGYPLRAGDVTTLATREMVVGTS